jgi:hypothetical protein
MARMQCCWGNPLRRVCKGVLRHARPSLLVVPANAGTHTPRRSFCRRYPTPAFSPISRSVWVPAHGRDDVVEMSSSINACLAISPLISREVCWKRSALSNQRAQGRPGARCTRGLVCKVHKGKRTRAYRFSGEHPAFPAQWFYGLLRALPGDRLSCHRRAADKSTTLDASVGASGPRDFAVRQNRARQSQLSRPPHPTARFVTIASRPSCRVRRAEKNH